MTSSATPSNVSNEIPGDDTMNPAHIRGALSSVGAIIGIVYSVKNKKSFWPSVGYFMLGSLTGSLAGIAINSAIKARRKK